MGGWCKVYANEYHVNVPKCWINCLGDRPKCREGGRECIWYNGDGRWRQE